jgi:hypothetical protein
MNLSTGAPRRSPAPYRGISIATRREAFSMGSTVWFSEGFDTADLKEAKALLDQLNG